MRQNGSGIKVMTVFWLVISVSYLLFAISLEDRRMPGDNFGWDPGSTAVPVGIGIVMTVVSLYLLISEAVKFRKLTHSVDAVAPAAASAAPTAFRADKLIILTISVTVLFITTFRILGFIIMTTFLMTTLIFFYIKQDVTAKDLKEYAVWEGISIALSIGYYTIGLLLIRQMRTLGRVLEIEIIRNRLVSVMPAIAVWALLIFLLFLVIRKICSTPLPDGAKAMLFSLITTLSLYLVFMQMFRVSLPIGILW